MSSLNSAKEASLRDAKEASLRDAKEASLRDAKEASLRDALIQARSGKQEDIDRLGEIAYPFVRKFVNNSPLFPPKGHSREDIAQEAMVRVIEYYHTFDPEKSTNASFWLGTIVRRTYCTRLAYENMQKRKGHQESLELGWMYEHNPDANRELAIQIDKDFRTVREANRPEDILADDELKEAFLKTLTKKELEAVEGRLRGNQYVEIANEHGCDKKSVDNALARVKDKIEAFVENRKYLKNEAFVENRKYLKD